MKNNGINKQSEPKRLSKKQMDVLNDLFEANLDEYEVLKKHKISTHIYRKWLADKQFFDELCFRAESSRRLSEMIIAKHAPAAAVRLIGLTESDKEETARKACLDVMALPATTNTKKEKPEIAQENISPEVAGRLLAALARETRK
jgi:hypothetical protein